MERRDRTMTGKAIQDLVGRVMLDRDFLAELVRDPDRVLAGYALTPDERAIVLEALGRGAPVSARERRLRRGDVLFRVGDPGEELFLLREGSIVVSKPVTGRVEQVLGRIEPGEAFGEMSVFGDERHRSATCQAEADSVLYSLDRVSLDRFIASDPMVAARFFQHMAQAAFRRLRDSSDLVAEVTRWGLEATGLDVEHG